MPPVTLPADLQHQYAEINGIRMHYVEAGQGPEVVLFLHGFPESWYSWRHQLAAFAPEYRVVAPDQRGYNETEQAGPYDVETLQADVLGLIAHLGVEKVHLVGHDWGAAIAWLIGMNHPAVLHSLTICNVPHPALMAKALRSNPRQLLRSWYIFFFQLPWLPERFLAAGNYQRLARALIRDCKPGTFTREDIKEFLAEWRAHGLGGGVNWYRAAFNLRGGLSAPDGRITVPTLLIWGERDRALGKELTHGTEEYVDDLQVHYLPESSHWVQQDDPEAVNRLLREHFERVRTRVTA